ncbi:GlsB/YeaQ/YmgE family stress response membrane protein [Propioniciclava tarda]|uniref:GlsB/YeaQ/YmgE family stress response membrane protein n=1 Tax=Propioniciclava tarda TaxID=433330 RepID=A0A4Q9KR15_PROTD|nr:GlsB/YeaQ/YmgE family stress response membrane protein [Propioniciclava tarda]TBT96379.1 GlsB/YeaQ/YmgE family stress response membrane protein [Propioniciclava tarda]SMO36757.1 Uncharacterized membrane protein YeaQ/YmgE, transglycosylase-associated protein family [Propioniciclava tarda]
MGFLVWVIIGGIAGWVASLIMKTREGLLINIIVGIIGGLLGGWVLGLFGMAPEGNGLIASFLTALVGACILLAIAKAVLGGRAVGK